MASINKVYRGMQNGAETINNNLEAINSELTSGGNVVHKTGDESIAGNKTFTGEIKQKNDVNWTFIPGSANRAEYMRRGDTVTIRWDFTSEGTYDIALGVLPVAHSPQKRVFKSIPEASSTNVLHVLQINAFTGGSPGAITLFKATTGAVFSGQESFVVI
jgi:hypothetical protein